MNTLNKYLLITVSAILVLASSCHPSETGSEQAGEELKIFPDYADIIIPPNIAPLNFYIKNDGKAYFVRISNSKDRSVSVKSRSGTISIPLKAWKKLLADDPEGYLTISAYRKTGNGLWEKFNPVKNKIASQDIDPYIAFRRIPPANIMWKSMGIYQRSLEDFEESPIMVNSITDDNCMNCHAFNARNPEQFMFHMRAKYGGTFIYDNDSIHFVNTNSEYTRSAGAYPSWHPNGEIIAFSVNKINQAFNARIGRIANVLDKYSDIILYDIKNNSITRPAELATDLLENLPTWSNDGRKLYYICADKSDEDKRYNQIHYNLMAIDFETETRSFGHKDTLISADSFGKSVTFPRESPAGDFLSFIGLDYGYFSIYNREADVFLFNLKTGKISKPYLNSDLTESYPSWSGNGSWLMFVSKRYDGILSRVWFSFIDNQGNAGKPFVLPQKDPHYYDNHLYNFNRPEFISGKVELNPRKIFSIVKEGTVPAGFNEKASVNISSGATSAPTGKEADVYYHHD